MKSDWGLCVGISSYILAKNLPLLPGAVFDATAIHSWLIDPEGGGVPATQAELIVSPEKADPEAPDPTAGRIERFLRKLYRIATENQAAGNGFRVGRRLWLFYSGHGLGFPSEEDTGLLTADALPPYDLPHVAGRAWAEAFKVTAAFDEIALFMDCCRTEAIRTPLRRPALRLFKSPTAARMMVGYAVAENKSAYETLVDDIPRGQFTRALESLLKAPRSRPMTARQFLSRLEQEYPEVDPSPPPSRKTDFEFLPASSAPEGASLLVAHGESTVELAAALAELMRSHSRSPQLTPTETILASPLSDLARVKEVVVAKELDLSELQLLASQVRKATKRDPRIVLYAERDPGVDSVSGARFLRRHPPGTVDHDAVVRQLDVALSDEPGVLSVQSPDALARIRVWNSHGQQVAQGYGTISISVPAGSYQVRASLGRYYIEQTTEVRPSRPVNVRLSALPLPISDPQRLLWERAPGVGAPSREIVEVNIHGQRIALSVPQLQGWRTELFANPAGAAVPFSLRMTPSGHAPGARYPTDALRANLEHALAVSKWPLLGVVPDQLTEDPVAALLASALALRNDLPSAPWRDVAAALLGDDDVDVRLLYLGGTIEYPPSLSLLWRRGVAENIIEVESSTPADDFAGRELASDPYLSWTLDDAAKYAWLPNVATAVWPGWDAQPDPLAALNRLEDAAPRLGIPADSLRRRTRKSPPVPRLVRHDRVAFLGATNDQLPAALAVAFVERGRQPWQSLEVWSLTDEALESIISDGRTGRDLVIACRRAEGRLRELLKGIAKQWRLLRYPGFRLDQQLCFASLWDWEHPGGYLHLSPHAAGQDVRTTSYEDLEWHSGEPPELYARVCSAFAVLQPAMTVAGETHA